MTTPFTLKPCSSSGCCAFAGAEKKQRSDIASRRDDALFLISVFLRNDDDGYLLDRPEVCQACRVGLRGVLGAARRIYGIRLRAPLSCLGANDARHNFFPDDGNRNLDKL